MRHSQTQRVLLALSAPIVMCCAVGCHSTPQSTRLRLDDFNVTVQRMAESLVRSEFFTNRGPASEPVYITINKVLNLTSDIIPEAEQWMLMARVQGALSKPELARKNVYFQITPEQHARLRAAGFEGDLGDLPRTTHVLRAVFMSARRGERDDSHGYVTGRQDYYYLEYAILELDTRRVAWSETFEFKRQAAGLAVD